MTTSFKQGISSAAEYLWSNAANWTNVVPVNGDAVTFNTGFGSNPSGYDDISNLFLDSLAVTSGFAAVGAILEIGTVSFGSTEASVFSDTDLGAASATLTVDGFSGATDGRVGAFGANALTTVQSATDPGEIYQVDEGGELALNPTPHGNPGPTNAGFYYQNSHGVGVLPSGTFAFRDPGGTVSSLLAEVAIGDSIALPGSDVASVTFGSSSLSVVTNLGITTFTDVTYLAGSTPTGYTVSTDPTGLERITFTSQQTATFHQVTATNGEYLWSTTANWVGGVVPGTGAAVTFNTGFGSNPSGYDDISNLFLDSLAVTSGFAAVGAILEIGTVSFGSTEASVFSDTDLGAASATLTVDGFSGATDGRVGAFGANALTTVQSATDPGEIYQVDEGGELALNPTPHGNPGPTNAGFYYQNSHGVGVLPSGTFAFRDPGGTVSSLLAEVAIGDSIALPGSDVASVTFGSSSLSVVTNLGITTFTDVTYLAGSTPTGYTVSTDPTGLERITFTSQQTATFHQVTATNGEYLWSTTANWVGGVVPGTGAAVTFNTGFGSNPSGYDDISNLFLDSLAVTSGFAAVGAILEIGTVSFGSTEASVFSDTDLGAASATLTVDGFSGATDGRVGAFGANALTTVQSATDPGEIYQVDEGGELALNPTPHGNPGPTNAGFYYQNSHGVGVLPSGTFAFRDPGGTVSSLLAEVAIGDSIALPGSDVASVTFGSSSLSVVTNLGITTFTDVTYLAGSTPTGYMVSTDPTGLERITFTSQQTATFHQVTATNGEYLWSTTANWVGGVVPGTGAAVTFNTGFGSNPSGYDDISNLFLDSLAVTSGFAAVGAILEIGTVSFGSTEASVFSDTDLGAASATLTVDGFSGATDGRVGAFGANALTTVQSATDPGEIYQVDEGGELALNPTPHGNPGPTNAGFYYQNSHGVGVLPSGTFAFRDPGGTVSSLLAEVAIGDSIALPGSDVASVTFGSSSLSVVTNLGITTFTDVTYLAGSTPTGYMVSTDPTGLERITFTSQQTATFHQVTATNGEYLWSTTANWVGGVVPGTGAAVTFNTGFGSNPSGYDDISNLFLDSLAVTSGFAAVGAILEIGTVSFGSTEASVFSDTDLGAASATLTVDGFSGTTDGRVGAFGTNALTTVQSATDPGEIYQVDEGGELVLYPTPAADGGPPDAGFYYQNSHGVGALPSGTFAFENPGGTISALVSSVAVGDSVALPGSGVSSVIFGTSTIAVVTNFGGILFNDVTYSGTTPNGYILSTDPSGLQRVTFATVSSTTFRQGTAGTVGGSSEYLWSNSANWTNGVPINGSTATFSIASTLASPGGYDDIGALFLDSLSLSRGYIAVGGTLTIGRLAMSENRSAGIVADTLLTGDTASVTIDGLTSASHGSIGAEGGNAITTVLAATDFGESYSVDRGGELVMNPTPIASSSFTYQDTTEQGTFAFAAPGTTISSPLAGVAVGDSIALPGAAVSSVTFGANSLTAVTNLGTTTFSDVTYTGALPIGFTASTDPTGLERITFTLCFCAHTLIRTPQGDVPVENLAIGDTVLTWRGESRPITWIGVGRVLATRGRRTAATPVVIQKGALGDNVPHVDLRVTKGHSLYIDGVLIPVEYLVNHRTILWDDRAQEVSIYHIELATHDVLVANGAPAESYRDDGNRWLFQNANTGWGLPSLELFAPVLTDGPVVDAAWRRLLERAGPRPGVPLTHDPDLHLLADGQRVDVARRLGDRHVFRLRRRPETVRIVSRAAAPQELGLARDPRLLGVALRRIVASQSAWIRLIEANDALLVNGFHEFEPDNGFRWTDGDATMPNILVAGFTGPVELVLHIDGTARYLADHRVQRAA